jgi:hypothetical protein
MKKVLLLSVIFALLLIPCLAQENNSQFVVSVNGKQGYIDKTGKIIIKPQFDDASKFSEGLARVGINGLYGFIDESGKIVIKPQFGWVKSFSEGLAAVEFGGKRGFINKEGELAIKPQFEEVQDFSDGLAAVKIHSKTGFLYKRTKNILPDLWAYIDKTGNQVIPPQFIFGYPFRNGVARFWTGAFSSINKYGLINKSGKEIIEPIFDNIEGDFNEGLAPFRIGNKWGFINESGQIIIKAEFDAARRFSEGFGRIAIKNKYNVALWGYVNRTGKIVVEPQFADAFDFSEGLARVNTFNDKGWKTGFINKTGNIVIKPEFVIAEDFRDGLAKISVPSKEKAIHPHNNEYRIYKSGYIDKTGKWIWKPRL